MKALTQLRNKMNGALKAAFVAMALAAPLAQQATAQEKYGNTFNIGLGLGYYGYLDGVSTPFILGNYEFDVARQFTLAPFAGFASFRSARYYGDHYYYRETVIPVGIKGTYYFDRLLGAGPDWDFYLAGSLGANITRVVWDDGYAGDRSVYRSGSPIYLDLHIGSEYHFNKRLGMFLDLSTGVSSIGLAVHGR